MLRFRPFVAALVVALLFTLQLPVLAKPGQLPNARRYLIGLHPGVRAGAVAGSDARILAEWPALGAAAVEATEAGRARLAAHRGVAFIEEDRPVYALHHASPTASGEITWGLDAVHAPAAWQTATGTGVRVCVLDTGIDYGHPEFYRDGVSIVKGSKNFVDDGHPDAADGNGHGTHVAGTIAAQLDGAGVAGVAHGVELYVARVLGDDGSGTTSGVLNGLNWCLDTVKAHVASLSLGSSRSSRTERKAFDHAYKQGMLIVAASGNDGTRKIRYPAKYGSVVAVGAVDSQLARASFSNYGKELELVAPGVQVLSTVPRGSSQTGRAEEDGAEYPANPLQYAGTGSVSGPFVECGLAGSTSSCADAPATGEWIALIDRGSISFADKVKNVMAQGAAAAVIANNDTANPDDPGLFTLGSSGTWIPAVSVSYNSGQAIRSGGLATGAAAVEASDYAFRDGTSMAAPHAAAVAALAWSANLKLKNTDIRCVLRSTAHDLGAAGWDQYYGYGLVQAQDAVARAAELTSGGCK